MAQVTNQPPALSYIPIPTYSRHPKPATGEDGFFAQTLSSTVTIPSVHTFKNSTLDPALPSQPPTWPEPTAPPQLIPVGLGLEETDSEAPGAGSGTTDSANAHGRATANPNASADLLMLLRLASPGVCGHPGTAHGGVLATVIDEAMSLGVTLYAPEAGEGYPGGDLVRPASDSESSSQAAGQDQHQDQAPSDAQSERRERIRSNMFTAQLDVRYKKPVSVPGDVEVRVKVLAKQGKKLWVRAQVVQGGDIAVDAMAFWLLTVGTKSVL